MAEVVKDRKSAFVSTVKKDEGGIPGAKLGDLLMREGLITKNQLEEAAQYQKKSGGRIGSILLLLGYIDEDTIPTVLSRSHGYPAIDLSQQKIEDRVLALVPYSMAKEYFLFPVSATNNMLHVAMADPTDNTSVEEVQMKVRLSVKAEVCAEKQILEAYKKYYQVSDEEIAGFTPKVDELEEAVSIDSIDDFGSLVSEAADTFTVVDDAGGGKGEGDRYSASDAPIVKLVNGILIRAIKEGASDIHIEPFETAFYVRYRKDGELHKVMNLPLQIRNAMTSRIKIMSNMNISERRVPQDGRIKMTLGKTKAVDFRVSTLPTLFGESIVIRILDKSNLNVDLTKLGFTKAGIEKFQKTITRPYGLILVTGPTGSGKTTTLYSSLHALNRVDTKLLTAEDPVEFNFRGINQVLIREDIGLTFAAALRSFLRQDPDVIMVGEIRDLETAEIAIKAAMTGHMVLSTLHTNDCASTIGRLIDMGIPGYMVGSAVSMVLAQRLLRRICQKCKTPVTKISAALLKEAGFSPNEFSQLRLYTGKGCPECSNGYRGRVAIYEIMEVTENVKQAITSNVPESQLRKISMKEGMLTLRQEGLQKVREGVTTLEEVLAKTVKEKEMLPAYLLNPDEQVYEDGDLIIKEGNTDKNFYKLIQGCLVVTKNGIMVGEISQPSEYFGEMSALTNEPRTATIRSKGKSIVKVFPGDKLPEVLEKYPEIATHIVTTLAKRLNEANNRILAGQNGSDKSSLEALEQRAAALS